MRKRKFRALWLLAAAVLAGGAAVLCWAGRPVHIHVNTELYGADETLRAVLAQASLAASSHNTQPWRVEADPRRQRLTVSVDRTRALDAADPAGRELYISVGCYLEALASAFDAYGCDTAITCAGEAAVVSYRKRAGAETDRAQLDILRRRHTDKRRYRTDPLDPEAVEQLLAGTEGVFCFERGSAAFAYLSGGTLEAVAAQAADPACRAELNRWMRFSNRETEAKRDGICAEMLGLRGVVKALYYLTTSHQSAEGDRFARQGVDTARGQVENCAAFFVVTGPDTPAGWMEAGRRTQAFWYRCTALGISLQPMSAMLETDGGPAALREALGLPESAQMILRAGYVDDYGENAAVRRDLEAYVTVK